MAYIENIVIGKPIAEPQQMFALDEMIGTELSRKRLIIPVKDFFLEFLWN